MNEVERAADRLSPISLEQVERTAALDTRIDRKYLLDDANAVALITDLSDRLDVLDIDRRRTFTYRSEYFDTPDLALHRAAAYRRRRRYKVRTRLYAHINSAMLEVKAKHLRGHTVKHRFEHRVDGLLHLDSPALDFVRSVVGDRDEVETLEPSLTTSYDRVTLVDRNAGTRFTIDRQVRATTHDGRGVELSGTIVETKSPLAPGIADRWLWQHGLRPLRFSKYCTMLAELHPDLPRNKWHRSLQRADLSPV